VFSGRFAHSAYLLARDISDYEQNKLLIEAKT